MRGRASKFRAGCHLHRLCVDYVPSIPQQQLRFTGCCETGSRNMHTLYYIVRLVVFIFLHQRRHLSSVNGFKVPCLSVGFALVMLRPWSRLAKIHLRQRFTPHDISIFPLINNANQVHGGHTVASAGAAGAAGSAPYSTAKSHLQSRPLVTRRKIAPAATKHQGGVLCPKSAAPGVRESFFGSVVSICTVGHNSRSQLSCLGAAVISRHSFPASKPQALPARFKSYVAARIARPQHYRDHRQVGHGPLNAAV
jgi:hypothetical protein